MEQQLTELLDVAKTEIDRFSDLKSLEALRVKFLGKKGQLTSILKGVGALPSVEKPKMGKLVNAVKQQLQEAIEQREQMMREQVLADQLQRDTVDISLPGRVNPRGSLHPVTSVKARVVELFATMGFDVVEGPEVEDEYHNFEALNMPALHPARAMQDTFYFSDNTLLRTHTSPVQIREMKKNGAPIRLISLGRVYRRDSDQTHTPMFHQVEGLVVERHCSFSDLKGVLSNFLNQFFETDLTLRFRPSYFPFTEPSAEVDIYKPATQDWMEVLGCGMVHPQVLRNVDLDPDEFTGYAFGIGLDRLAMLHFGIPDLRLLFENDIRFLNQF